MLTKLFSSKISKTPLFSSNTHVLTRTFANKYITERGYKSYAKYIHLKDDPKLIEEYKWYHVNSFPEILESLKAVGITKMQIYLTGVKLFMYMETVPDFVPERDFPKHMELSPRCVEWGNIMTAMQTEAPEAKEGEWWIGKFFYPFSCEKYHLYI